MDAVVGESTPQTPVGTLPALVTPQATTAGGDHQEPDGGHLGASVVVNPETGVFSGRCVEAARVHHRNSGHLWTHRFVRT